MTYIIAEPCVDVKDAACVDVCPVDCIYVADEDSPNHYDPEVKNAPAMLYIHPEECIDCAACEPVCPVTAIFAEDDTPPEWDKYIDLNYEYFGILQVRVGRPSREEPAPYPIRGGNPSPRNLLFLDGWGPRWERSLSPSSPSTGED